MKRDMDLVREILIELSEANEPLDASVFVDDKRSYELIGFHFEIMDEAGLIIAKTASADMNPYYSARAIRLTWQGCEFLAATSSSKVWASVKKTIAKAATDAPLIVYKEVAQKIIKGLTDQML